MLGCIFLLFLLQLKIYYVTHMAELRLHKKITMNLHTKFAKYLTVLGIISLLVACDPQKRINSDFNYFQTGLDSLKNMNVDLKDLKLLPNDFITVQVVAGSLRQEDAALFNMSGGSSSSPSTSSSSAASSGVGYQIDETGFIEMPKIGKIKAAGLTKVELSEVIKNKLTDEVKNPLVIVKLSQLKANVLGEVKKPGVVTFKSDKANIFDALSEAGDLTDAGKREDIVLIRQENGKLETYKLDLRSTAFMRSAAFQIHQNDVIYVGANINKLKTLNVNPNFQRDLSLGLTVISTLALILNTISIIRR